MENQEWFSVTPRTDCRHITLADSLAIDATAVCGACGCAKEVWLCLSCGFHGCSRYQNGCMARHIESGTLCHVAFSYADGSFWCFRCTDEASGMPGGSYIVSPVLSPISRAFEMSKFGEK